MSTRAQQISSDTKEYMRDLGARARAASRVIASASTAHKNSALSAIADAIEANLQVLRVENTRDLDAGRNNNLAAPLLDRLELTESRIAAMAHPSPLLRLRGR